MERSKYARVDSLLAALSCPLCFETVKDCVVTPCGHSFCRSCAGDAVTRRHSCPVCQVGVIGGEAGLIRNFLVDDVAQSLRRATDETDVAYMRLLFRNASSPVRAGAGGKLTTLDEGREDSEPSSMLSPLEGVLIHRMRDTFLGYQAYFERERAAHEAEVRSLSERLRSTQDGDTSADMDGGPTDARGRTAQALEAAIEDSRERFKASMQALLRDFDAHAVAAMPPPSLLPATVTVVVVSRGLRFDTQLLPTHFPANVYNKSPGGRIGAGWALVVDGAIQLRSEEVKPCFAREYSRAGQDPPERVDYFTCGECSLNWICAACATHCHQNCRDVKPFSLNHLPTWACCYCSKKRARKGCKLVAGETGAVPP